MNLTSIAGRPLRAAMIALTVAAIAAPTAAEAGRRTRTAVGVGVAAGALGLALGAAAANENRDRYVDDERVVYEERRYVRPRPRCWTERRAFEDRYGDVYYKRVEVCR